MRTTVCSTKRAKSVVPAPVGYVNYTKFKDWADALKARGKTPTSAAATKDLGLHSLQAQGFMARWNKAEEAS